MRSTTRHEAIASSMAPSAIGPSIPDLGAPTRMSLDPVGTPRRSGSSSSPANSTNLHSNAGSSRALRDSRYVTHDDHHLGRLWARYIELQENEGKQNALLEEVLTHYAYLQQTHNEYVAATEAELMLKSPSREVDNYKADIGRLVDMLQIDPFVLVLIDGDGMFFGHDLLPQGETGGIHAASLLNRTIAEWMRGNIPGYSSDFQIVTRIYCNVKAMADNCVRTGFVSSATIVEDFVRGFMRSGDLFDFIDVGFGSEGAMVKINAMLKLHVRGYQCRHILVGCAETDGYAHMFERYSRDATALQDMTLVGAKPFEKQLAAIPIRKITLPALFSDTTAFAGELDAHGDPVRTRHDSRSNFNPNSGVFTPASQTPAPVTPRFSPHNLGGRVATPIIPQGRDTESVTSSSAISEAPPIAPAATNVAPPAKAWSSIAQRSAHLPLKDLTRPAPEPKANGPVVRQNKFEQRLDPHMDYDHERVFELKKLKLCNQHYIGRGCCHWQAKNGACPHKHEYPLSMKDKKWLRVVARETVCKKGTYCVDFECIYGHHCPYPKANEGSMRGIGCINGDACRFGREMHGMDMTVAKVLQPKDLE